MVMSTSKLTLINLHFIRDVKIRLSQDISFAKSDTPSTGPLDVLIKAPSSGSASIKEGARTWPHSYDRMKLTCAFVCVALAAVASAAVVDPRVVNGVEAMYGQFPYHSLIFRDGVVACGGALLSATWVLTSRNCATTSGLITVTVGARKINGDALETHRQVQPARHVQSWLELGLIEVDAPFTLSEFVSPIRLPALADIDNMLEGNVGVLAGYGVTGGATPSELLRYALAVIGDPLVGCTGDLNHLCTDGAGDGCRGDEGGALAVDVNSKPVLVGILEIAACGTASYNVYQRITRQDVLQWIQLTTGLEAR